MAPAMVRPFPWRSLPRVGREHAATLRRLAALVGPPRAPDEHAPLATLLGAAPRVELTELGATASAHDVAARVGPHAALLRLRLAGAPDGAWAIALEPLFASRVVARALGADGAPLEAPAPRALSDGERGALGALALAWLAETAPGARLDEVEPDLAGLAPLFADGPALLVSARVEVGALTGEAVAVLPERALLATQRPPFAERRGPSARIRVEALVVVGAASLSAGEAAALTRGDVILLEGGARPAPGALCTLRIGDAWAPLRVRDPRALEVAGPLEVGAGGAMSVTSPALLERALRVELVVVAGRTLLPVGEIAALRPGVVLPLGAPLGAEVELHAGGALLGRGELVDVEGELGVRVVELVDR